MKKMIAGILLAIVLCTGVQAQNDTNINPLNIARAFSLKTPAYFKCQLYGLALVSNSWQRTTMTFFVQKSDFAITNLDINGKSIPLPKPIFGLPLGDGGIISDVYVSVAAYTRSGENCGYGSSQLPMVSKNDQIEVVLRPTDVRVEIPVDVSKYANDIHLEIENFVYGYGWGTDSDGKFYVSLPPVGGSYHYILRRWSTGEPIGEGYIEPFKGVKTQNDAFLGVTYMGNVLGANFQMESGDEWISIPKIAYNCVIPMTNGTNVNGQVIFMDVGSGKLELIISGDVDIYVQQVVSQGDMPFLELEDHSYHDKWSSETRVNTTIYKVGKVVVTLVPKSPLEYRPWLNIHRFYGLPASVGVVGKTEVVPPTP